MENYAAIYVQCSKADELKRIEFYLNGETRPDFPEDVPSGEAQFVEAFEFVPVPESLKILSADALAAHFYPDSLEEVKDLVKALALFKPGKLFMFFSDDGETHHYYRYQDGSLCFVFSEIPLDDSEDEKKYNRNLPTELAKTIENMDDKGKALELLAHSM